MLDGPSRYASFRVHGRLYSIMWFERRPWWRCSFSRHWIDLGHVCIGLNQP